MAAKPDYRLPMLPPVSLRFARDGSDHSYASAFDRDGVAWCARGCDALALVYRQAGLGPDDVVVVPAFHCPSIADATRRAGLRVAFHRIAPDLTPIDSDIVYQLQGGARALLLIHYFGFTQDVTRYRALCDEFGALLIEDCAHTVFGLSGGLLPGETGHFAIASDRKLFPLPDGGAALANSGPMDAQSLRPVTWSNELRCALRAIQHAADYGTLGVASRPLAIALDWMDRLRGSGKKNRQSSPDAGSLPDSPVEARRPLQRGSRVARRLRRATSVSRLAQVRRHNYRHLVGRLHGLPNCMPLFPDLLPGTVPYVVPVLVRNAQQHFGALKAHGVPMFRWEGIGDLGCEVTKSYSTDLIQLPCHQELSTADIDWIADEIEAAITGTQ